MHTATDEQADVILVGGGLANSLIALRLKALRPDLRLLLLERAPVRDATHTWSFFDSDLPPAAADWIAPLTAARWPSYDVRFPGFERRLDTGYASISGGGLGRAVDRALGGGVRRSAEAVEVGPARVRLADGRGFGAPLVVDGRGLRASRHFRLAWQKFFGLEIRVQTPHAVERPTVMDATVAQVDGFRFLYVLPLAPDVLLVEDTRYSSQPDLDPADLRRGIEAYAVDRGWRIAEVLRQEQGVLPITLAGDIHRFWADQDDGIPRAGMRAGLFHPTTGYSLPDAVRLAEAIARAPVMNSAAISRLVHDRSTRLWRERAFFRALNRMMFLAAAPEARYRVLERFYRLPKPLIERFYGARLTWADRMRLVIGEPPIPMGRALRALPPSAAFGKVA